MLIQGNEKGKINFELLRNCQDRVDIYNTKIVVKDSVIFELKSKQSLDDINNLVYEKRIANYMEQIKVSTKVLRRQKRKTILAIIAGVLTTSAVTYFAIR